MSGAVRHPSAGRSTRRSVAGPVLRLGLGLVWVAALTAAVALLHSLGQGMLSAPPVLDRAELRRWFAERDAVVVAFALLRLGGLALACYLLAVTVLGLAARLSRVPALVAAIDVATVPAVRRALGSVAGVSLTASIAGVALVDVRPPAPAAGSEAPVVLHRLPDRAATSAEGEAPPPPGLDDGTATMRVDDRAPEEPPPMASAWVVEPGQHLWGIAESVLSRSWGREPSEAEVAPYWTAVVDENRSRLLDPTNPDLIRPGQALVLPTVPPPPGAGAGADAG